MGLAKPVDHFRASDISFWGAFALVVWALALLGSNAAGLIPQNVFAGLHASRLEGATLNQLRSQVATLESEAARLKQENSVLLQRFVLNEQANGEVTRRVGALELTVPRLLDALNGGQPIDFGTTASTSRPATSFDTDGGSVSYTTTPLSSVTRPPQATQPLPEALLTVTPDSNSFGVALGPPIDPDEGESAWRSITDRVGALLLGLGPMLANVEGGGGKRLVVGPVNSEAEARQLCGRMAKIGIACASVPFVGEPLALLN